VALELQRRLGEQVRAWVALSWLVLDPPPPFLGVLEALQDPAREPAAREGLFAMWTKGAPSEVAERVRAEMGAYDFQMWARAGREIAAAYRQHGSPLRALAASGATTPLLHLYSQPRTPDFLAAQEAFARDHACFQVKRLDAISHFLPLEAPDATADAIDAFLG
jgi:pimeloyl-ACP methyl ester carboxylesterase